MTLTRKLAAIIVADIAGYSRLMRADEEGTYKAVKGLREELLPKLLPSYDGQLIKDMGDGFLIAFDSAVQAVQCSIALQEALADHQMLELRIGVNVGDVIFENSDVFGDGVNVAARLEAICVPGGVAMSENTYEQVRDKLNLAVETLEPQLLKNIDRPVGVRLWSGTPKVKTEQPTFELPDKPSIAVLAFDNMSSDPEQDFFADGIAEDIITALSRIERFFVVSRTSSFSFKGQTTDIKKIGKELGVRYVLEGSVRAAGRRLRVTAQLIEAATGRHIWAEKYDRMAEDVFDIQDEITQSVTATTQLQIDLTEGEEVVPTEREQLPVWKLINLAWRNTYALSADALPKAIDYSKKAVALDPSSGRAFQVLSAALYHHAVLNRPDNLETQLAEAISTADQAVSLSPNLEYAYWSRALAMAAAGDHEKAVSDFDRALEINPNCSLALGSRGTLLARLGRADEAIKSTNLSIRANPRDPSMFFRYWSLGMAYYFLGDFVQSVEWAKKTTRLKPDWQSGYTLLAMAFLSNDQEQEAKDTLDYAKTQCKEIELENERVYSPQTEPHRENWFNSLKAFGLN